MKGSLKRLISILKKTKESKCFILDNYGEISHVLLSFEEFERLSRKDLTDDRFLSNINREIAFWKAEEEEKNHNCQIDDENDEFEEDKYYLETVDDEKL